MHLLMGSLICSGTLYVGEYLPVKQFVPLMVGPKGLEFIIILSCEYIIPYIIMFQVNCKSWVSIWVTSSTFKARMTASFSFTEDTWVVVQQNSRDDLEPWVAAVADTILLHEPKWEPTDFRLARERFCGRDAPMQVRKKSTTKLKVNLMFCCVSKRFDWFVTTMNVHECNNSVL